MEGLRLGLGVFGNLYVGEYVRELVDLAKGSLETDRQKIPKSKFTRFGF